MRRHSFVIGLAFLALAGFALGLGWAFYKASTPVEGVRTLGDLWPYALGGVLTLLALPSFLVWLGVYAARHGHEERR